MSGFANQNMGKTDSYDSLNHFIIEFFYHDVRNKNNLQKIFNLFDETKSVLQFDKYCNVTFLFQKVANHSSSTYDSLFEICSYYSNGERRYEGFLHCSSNIGHIIMLETLTNGIRPTAMCHYHKRINKNCDDQAKCYSTDNKSMQYVHDAFFNDVEKFLKPFFDNYSVGFRLSGDEKSFFDLFHLFSDNYLKLNESAKLLYEWFYDMFPKKYVNYTENERLNFHNSVAEILCHDIDSRYDLHCIQKCLKENALNLGMYYYMRLMTVVNMMGWFRVDYYFKMLSEICDEEKDWVLGIDEKKEFKEIIMGFMRMNFSSKGSVLKETKFLKTVIKFFSLKDGLRYTRKLFNEVEESTDFEARLNKYYDDLKELVNVVEQYPLKD